MGRRGDQGNAGYGVSGFCYYPVDLMAGQLASFSGFCTLGYLDLYLIGIYKVFGSYSETSACNLFNGAPGTLAIITGFKSFGVFSSLACIASAAYPVHCYGQRLMGLTAD